MLFQKQAKAVALPQSGKRQNEPANAKSHLTIKAVKTKKKHTFLHFSKHENYYNRAHIKTFPKPRPSRLINRTLQKLEVALFRKHEISTKNYIAKTSIWRLVTTRATRRTFTYSLPELGSVTLGFNPHTAPGAEDVVRRHRA